MENLIPRDLLGVALIQVWVEKSRIRETKHVSTDVDSSTDTKKILLERQNLQKKLTFFVQWFYTLYKQKFLGKAL